ncbi:NusG domain II-containing protein [Thermithiobacillus plumbiphilus]|uniref:NusG domain II-containing protein n=1 Tax=Thermithiobacillus plumbiphilus TaxID=1729899 RepID=A0ABU9DAQ9_9PROT
MTAWKWLREASTPADRVLILILLLLLPVLLWMNQSRAAGRTVQIFEGKTLIAELPLDQDRRVTVEGPLGPTLVEIHDGRAHVVSSPCSGKQCIRAGWQEKAQDSAACVPNHVLVLIPGEAPGNQKLDAIAE